MGLSFTADSLSFSVFFLLDWVSSEVEVFLEDYVAGVGDTVDLSCTPRDFLVPIVWQKDGDAVSPNNRTRVGQKVLHIINVSYEDSGVYSCRHTHSSTLLSNYTVRVTGQSLRIIFK